MFTFARMNIGNTLVVSGAKNGTIVRVYSVDGKLLEKKVVENNSVSVVANAPLVIVKVGEQSFKVALKIQK